MNRNSYGAKWAPKWCWEQAERELGDMGKQTVVENFIAVERRAVEIYAAHDAERTRRMNSRNSAA